MAATKTIQQTEFFPGVAPASLYQALVNSKQHAEFTGARATGAAKAGARFTAWDGYISGKHLELDRGKRIVQEWITTEWPDGAPPSRVEWTFTAKDGGAEATLVHSAVPASQVEAYRKGWVDYYWTPLKQYLLKPKSPAARDNQ